LYRSVEHAFWCRCFLPGLEFCHPASVRRALALGLNYDFYQCASGSISGVIAL
jgi:hypothetical protein